MSDLDYDDIDDFAQGYVDGLESLQEAYAPVTNALGHKARVVHVGGACVRIEIPLGKQDAILIGSWGEISLEDPSAITGWTVVFHRNFEACDPDDSTEIYSVPFAPGEDQVSGATTRHMVEVVRSFIDGRKG